MTEPKKKSSVVRLESEPALIDTSWQGDGRTREGWVGTKLGLVLAYVAFPASKDGPRTVLRFTAKGRVHEWVYQRACGDRAVGRLAAKMARTLSQEEAVP
jgi:hypothetical protein